MSVRLLLAAALIPAAAPASAPALYRATLAAPSTQTMVVRETRWVCAGTACAAPRSAEAADTTICAAVARKVGAVTHFEAADRVFDEAELARCNAAAR